MGFDEDLLTPFDSVSEAGKHIGRGYGRSSVATSRRSSTARFRAAAERAALVVEAASLRKQQKLAHDKLQLEQEAARLKLETQIAKAEADGRVYGELCDDQRAFVEMVKLEPLEPTVPCAGLFNKAPAESKNQQPCGGEAKPYHRMPDD